MLGSLAQQARNSQRKKALTNKSTAEGKPSIRMPMIQTKKNCACGGGCSKCNKKQYNNSGLLQTKLQIGNPNDIYEQEADKVADQVMAASPNATISDGPIQIQRLPRQMTKQGDVSAPASVDKTLAGSGKMLGPVLMQDMSQHFGYNFSQVRIHSGEEARQSAQDVKAHAYTVGHNIVFGAGKFAPETQEGRHLLAHELTHVVQQSGSENAVQSGAHEKNGASNINNLASLTTSKDSSLKVQRRVGDPAQRPPSLPCQAANSLPHSPAIIDVLFPNGGAVLDATQKNQISSFVASWHAMGGNTPVQVDGFASTDGSEISNWELSCQRAQNVAAELSTPSSGGASGIPSGSITFVAQGETDEFSASDAAPNRRVTINTPAPQPAPTPPPTPVVPPTTPEPATNGVCGPDVTAEVTAAVANTRSTYAGWNNTDKRSACDALDSLVTGAAAWDIMELHNQGWILGYRPACATQGATPPCGSTVKIGSDCYYAGSPNYVIFGVMCQLCNSHFTSIGDVPAADRFTQSKMQYWINFYKGTGPLGISTPSGNFGPSRDWANAGYTLWPASSAPAGDRNNCAPTCPTAYTGGAFTVHWIPHGVF